MIISFLPASFSTSKLAASDVDNDGSGRGTAGASIRKELCHEQRILRTCDIIHTVTSNRRRAIATERKRNERRSTGLWASANPRLSFYVFEGRLTVLQELKLRDQRRKDVYRHTHERGGAEIRKGFTTVKWSLDNAA